MKTIYIHPKATPCSVETHFLHLKKFVPLTLDNILKNFKIVSSPEHSDYIFLGQIIENKIIPDEFIEICKNNPKKVIVDLEGDFGSSLFNSCFKNVITCAGGPDKSWGLTNCFVRPQLSKVLLELHCNNYQTLPVDSKALNFYFQGQVNVPNRIILLKALQQLNLNNIKVSVNNSWGGNLSIQDSEYCNMMNSNLLSLCPKGVGGSSIRFYESCFFGSVPILIGNDEVMSEHTYDTSFIFRIPDYNDISCVKHELDKINKTDAEQLRNRGKRARQYYDDVVKPHLDDPMSTFLRWLER